MRYQKKLVSAPPPPSPILADTGLPSFVATSTIDPDRSFFFFHQAKQEQAKIDHDQEHTADTNSVLCPFCQYILCKVKEEPPPEMVEGTFNEKTLKLSCPDCEASLPPPLEGGIICFCGKEVFLPGGIPEEFDYESEEEEEGDDDDDDDETVNVDV